MRWPSKFAGKGKEMEESNRKRVLELRKNDRTEKCRIRIAELIEEDTLNWVEFNPESVEERERKRCFRKLLLEFNVAYSIERF